MHWYVNSRVQKKFNGVFFCSRKQLHQYIDYAIRNKYQYGISVWHKTNPVPLCNNTYLSDLEFIVYIKGKKSSYLRKL